MMWHSLGSEPKTHVQLHLKNKIWRPLHLCSTTLLHYKAVLLRILTLSINHPALLDSSLLWIHDRETSFCLDLFERNSFILTVLWVHSSSIAFKSHDVTTCVWCHYESVYGKLDLSGVVWDLKDKDLARFMFYLPSCYCFFFFSSSSDSLVWFWHVATVWDQVSGLEQTRHRRFRSVLTFIFVTPLFTLGFDRSSGDRVARSKDVSVNCPQTPQRFGFRFLSVPLHQASDICSSN